MRKLLALILLLAPLAATAQTFPTKPVTLLVTFPAGGPTDIAGRALAEATSKYLGQNVIVENNQPVWYLATEDYTKWAREQYEKERKIIQSLGLARKK